MVVVAASSNLTPALELLGIVHSRVFFKTPSRRGRVANEIHVNAFPVCLVLHHCVCGCFFSPFSQFLVDVSPSSPGDLIFAHVQQTIHPADQIFVPLSFWNLEEHSPMIFFASSGVVLFLRKCADRPTSFFWVVFISCFFLMTRNFRTT